MKKLQYIALSVAFFAILGIAGNYDWAEEVLENVPVELYRQIKSDLGGNPTEVEIAEHYLDNKQRYDGIADAYGW